MAVRYVYAQVVNRQFRELPRRCPQCGLDVAIQQNTMELTCVGEYGRPGCSWRRAVYKIDERDLSPKEAVRESEGA